MPGVKGSKYRRIDFLTVPWQSRGAALLYYTVSCLPLNQARAQQFNIPLQGDDIVR